MKKYIVSAIVFMSIMLWAVPEAGAMGFRGSRSGAQGGFETDQSLDPALDELNLNKKQEAQVAEIKREHRSALYSAQSRLRDLRFELNMKLDEHPLNFDAIDGLVQQIGDATHALLQVKVDFVKSLHGVLTKDQIQKLNTQKSIMGVRSRRSDMDSKRSGREGRQDRQDRRGSSRRQSDE